MPYYKGVIDELLTNGHGDDARDVAGTLLSLRHRLSKEIPPRNVQSSVLIATWNIRELGADVKYGKRLDEALLYIAEIISHFDLVAVQEVNQNLANLQMVMRLLGGWWEYLVTDVTIGSSGNSERIAFIYDGRKVRFDHLAGELALPAVKGQPVVQPARSPFMCAFRVGWRRITLCSVHIFYGQSKPDDPRRIQEIQAISAALAKRNEARQNIADGEPESVVLLGDFNIFDVEKDATAQALKDNKFIVPESLKLPLEERVIIVDKKATNLTRDRHFDQIAFHDPKTLLQASRGGVFDFQTVMYGPDKADDYLRAMQRSAPDKVEACKGDPARLNKLYRQWRTFQLSDHLPLWVELKTDFANNYLGSVLHGKKTSPASVEERKEAEATSPVTTPPPIARGAKTAAKTAAKKTAKNTAPKTKKKPA